MENPNSELESAIRDLAEEMLRGAPPRLRESVLYSLLGPGKRIRPRLVLAVGEAFALPRSVTLRIATSLEMVHAYTLIHDDLPALDNDDFRRGRPTNHREFGEGIAVLAGDSLALLAPDSLLALRSHLPAERVLDLIAALLEAAGPRGVIAGQAAEMAIGGGFREKDRKALIEIFRLKTGALFRAAVSLPAIAAGAESAVIRALGRFGEAMGIAFQIADDLEDDFDAKRTDPAHIAAYGEADTARAFARDLLTREAPEDRFRQAMTPFMDELTRKLAGNGR